MNLVYDSETLTVSDTAIGLTTTKVSLPTDARDFSKTFVTIYAEGSIRFWTSGKIPSTTDGIPMFDGTERTFSIYEANKFKAIRNGMNDAKIHVQYCTTR